MEAKGTDACSEASDICVCRVFEAGESGSFLIGKFTAVARMTCPEQPVAGSWTVVDGADCLTRDMCRGWT